MFIITRFIKYRVPYSPVTWNFRGGKKKLKCLPFHFLFLLMPNFESFQLDKKLMNCGCATSNPCSISTGLVLGWAHKRHIIGDSQRMGEEKESDAEVGPLLRNGKGN